MSNDKLGMNLKTRMVVRNFIVIVIAMIAIICLFKAFSGNANSAKAANTTDTTVVTATPVETSTVASTPAPILTAKASTPSATPATAKVKSSEISRKSIIQDGTGIKQMMVFKADLSKLNYEEIVINVWDGVSLLANSKGVVGEIYGREAVGYRRNTKSIEENVAKTFFNNAGELYADNTREGDAHQSAEFYSYSLNKVRFVQLEGENFYRLVVVGTLTTVKGSTGSSSNASNPTQEPSYQPDYDEIIVTPAPELRPSDENVASVPNPTLRPRDDIEDNAVAMPNPTLRDTESVSESSSVSTAPAPSLSSDAGTASMPGPSLRDLDFD